MAIMTNEKYKGHSLSLLVVIQSKLPVLYIVGSFQLGENSLTTCFLDNKIVGLGSSLSMLLHTLTNGLYLTRQS